MFLKLKSASIYNCTQRFLGEKLGIFIYSSILVLKTESDLLFLITCGKISRKSQTICAMAHGMYISRSKYILSPHIKRHTLKLKNIVYYLRW